MKSTVTAGGEELCNTPIDDGKDSDSGCRGCVRWTPAGGGFPERRDREWPDTGKDLPAGRAKRILSRNPVRLVGSRLQPAIQGTQLLRTVGTADGCEGSRLCVRRGGDRRRALQLDHRSGR